MVNKKGIFMKRISISKTSLVCLALVLVILLFAGLYDLLGQSRKSDSSSNQVHTARVVANGDILVHDILYMSAR